MIVQFRAWIALLRPLNVLMFLGGVLLGGLLEGELSALTHPELWIAALSATLIGGAANALNDYFDRETDRINHPHRPLPAGDLPPAAALRGSLCGFTGGVLLALLLSPLHVAIAVAAILVLVLYNRWLKHLPLIGNIIVALTVATSLLYGAFVISPSTRASFAALFAFLVMLAREMVKDVEDLPGDLAAHTRTLPALLGPRRTLQLARTIIILTLFLSVLPYLLGYMYTVYLVGIAVTDLMLLLALDMQNPSQSSKRLKIGALLGMLTLALGSINP